MGDKCSYCGEKLWEAKDIQYCDTCGYIRENDDWLNFAIYVERERAKRLEIISRIAPMAC